MTRLVKGELNKMLLKPIIFVFVGVLVASLFITLITFAPKNKQDVYGFYNANYSSNAEIVQLFNTTSEFYGKVESDITIDNNKNKLAFYKNILNEGSKPILITNIETSLAGIKNLYNQGFKAYLVDGPASFNTTKAEQCAVSINSLKTNFNSLIQDYEQVTDKNTPIALIESKFDVEILELIKFAKETLNTDENGNSYIYTKDSTYNTFYNVVSKFDGKTLVSRLDLLLSKLDVITTKLSIETIAQIETIVNKTTTYLGDLNDKIQQASTNSEVKKSQLILDCTNYYLLTKQVDSFVQNSFYSTMLSGIKKSAAAKYKNFEGISLYSINEQKLFNEYLLNHSPILSPLDVNTSFSSDVSSENTASAFDFMFYGLSVSIVFIIIFCLIYGSQMLAEEHEKNTIKNLVTKPYSRNKIVSSKILSTIIFGIVSFIVCAIFLFLIGLLLFGSNFGNIVFVFNASYVVELSPLLYILIFIVLSSFKIVLFSCLAVMISTFFKKTNWPIGISLIVYLLTLFLNFSPINSAIMGILSPTNFDIFKYFGSTLSNAFVISTPMLSYGGILFSSIYIILLITIFSAIAHICFNKKEI